ncbi:hypothetical protein FACS189476_00630 [Spirochaetia bacterium]|nr:hypothetical protein FACS189476_00630 [Spirochaetia bacterium]
MKKNMVLFFGLLVVFFISLSGCATFGVWGGTDRINENEFIVTISIPPIAGGGTFANARKTAMDIAKAKVEEWGYRYFILLDGNTSETTKFLQQANYNRRGGSYTAQTFTNTNGEFHFYIILNKNEYNSAKRNNVSIIDIKY